MAEVQNPFFARVWPVFAAHEAESVRALRRENLAGLSGRVLEVGAGSGTNFAYYPDTVTQVVAVEPEPRLVAKARAAAADAPIPVEVTSVAAEEFSDGEVFDAVVCSLVLCSVHDQVAVLRRLRALLRPGGELRFLEHIASAGGRGRLQRLADATIWPRMLGNCHTHRDTERSIVDAGFEIAESRHEWTLPAWVPLPVSELALGRARRP
ncbi:methyltransferase domain-containing protein [Mycobacterium asiaticum]|uniref:methyltransferase domain-containing protein n=1 Tax=Mycobacterium asiaticum TaxID=1790 RepID=UPI0007EF5B69|nr:methyltransferase domain-containing protein [Mycobacterium asiaticum]OBI85540.1 phosphatidylethanolamine N-methyltransferase [Mycobacterium asiaticum]